MWRPSFTYYSKYSFFIAPSRFKRNSKLPLCIIKPKMILTNSYRTFSTNVKEKMNNNTIVDNNKLSKGVNTFTYRTHSCGELNVKNVGEKVILCGWVQYVRLSKFLLIRDAYGLTQCISKSLALDPATVPLETVIKIEGTVVKRPKDMINHDMATGEIEVVIDKLDILNEVGTIPFNLRSYQKPKEQLRLQHRFIDLRFPEMQHNLRQRSIMLHKMRRFLVEEYNFVEVETPTLFCRTPGGAREFVVPTRHPGLFYSLVQSPQQFKQMLMVGGVDRYFQIARCYRDETTRPDRQPEFTQLDIELSFSNLNHILTLIELLLYKTFTKELPKPPFPRLPYWEALERYGSDKPNLAHNLELINITNLFKDIATDPEFAAFALPYCNHVGKLTTKYKEKIKGLAKKYNVKIIQSDNISKDVSSDINERVKSIIGADNSCILALGDKENVCLSLGELREVIATLLKNKELIHFDDRMKPLWVVDFPLFVRGENGLETCHHPFTAPHPDDIHLLDKHPLKVKSLAYDLVLNGNEVGGGSVRIHDSSLQEKIFGLLNIIPDNLGHFMSALKSGCPPHAGIALGIDRLMAIACDAESIRDVIAFPKSHEGKDPMSGAPNKIGDKDKKYYGLK